MGFLSAIGKSKGLVSTTKANNLDATHVMATQAGEISPDKPGSWKHLAVPMPRESRQFNAAESNALAQRAAQVKAQVATTTSGYKAIRDISRGFTQANVDHETTRRVLATGTLESTKAKAASAGHLHELRPSYGQAQRRLELYAAAADGAIAAMG